jgi:Raf kinase inhibitor-like YbhB/YbcL family protein
MTDREHHPDHSGEAITIFKVDPILDIGIVVTSTGQHADGRLDDRHSAYHDNISPPLKWTDVPEVKAWAVIVEDPDAPQEKPFVHWIIWNIPGQVTALPEGLPNTARLITPQGAIQGRNGMHGYGWFGPRPPAGHGVHRYYFQVFALTDPILTDPETPLEELVNALKGHTLAKGEMMATYEAPEPAAHDEFRYASAGKGGGKSMSGGTHDDPVRNATVRGERPSPSDRDRGETSIADET